MKMLTSLTLLLAWAALGFSAEIIVRDGDINAGQEVRWTSNNTYILDGLVYVEQGAKLYIEPGTVIKGKETPSTGDNTSALIITRGAQIFATGTATQPIIFTAEADDVADPADLDFTDRGLWGGLILLGNASTNTTDGTGRIEGISSTEPRGIYGGGATPNDNDNSGVLRYVSVRHGGSEIGAGNEINGISFGAVGAGTTVEYVEVLSNLDDGFEWFGGTVNTRYLVAAFCADDGMDYDEGFRGKHQFWFVIQGTDLAGRGAEQDGGTSPEDGQPYAIPVIANATYIGPGTTSAPQGDGGEMLIFRDNAGGQYYGSIFTDYNGGTGGRGITVEDLASGEDSRSRLEMGQLVLSNNIWYNFAAGNDLTAFAPQDFVRTHFTANNNQIVDPQLTSISRQHDGQLDPRPAAGSPALNGATQPADAFFADVDYYGAFDPNAPLWTNGWTALYQEGITTSQITVVDGNINAGENVTWTANNVYLLDGLVYVEAGATLTIEPGTVIKGKETPSTGDNTSALIITRGAQIIAAGTQQRPIIFTAEADNVADPADLDFTDRGLWGGLILLGNASTNTTDGTGRIEGISSTEPRGIYGGGATPNDNDNSGVLRYVSVRHGGSEIGAGNEINGISFGAVGAGTTVEYVEVLSNLDDGFEWFGGTVNTRYLVAAFCADDGMDYDEGFRGKHQFWFVVQGTDLAGRGAEQDGGTSPEDGQPYAIPVIANATYIGPGTGSAPQGDGGEMLIFRDNAGGQYYGSIFTDYNGGTGGRGITVEDLASGEDSRSRLEMGQLVLSNNIWYNFAAGNDLAAFAPQDFVRTHFTANNNQIVDPQLTSISRQHDGQLDPRPAAGSPALNGATQPADAFFADVDYYGAFDPNAPLWTDGWTALFQERITSKDVTTGVKERVRNDGIIPASFGLSQNYPNPFNPSTSIDYAVTKTGFVRLTVYNVLGQSVATLVEGLRTAGTYSVTWDATGLTTGMYFYRLEAGGVVQTRKMLLTR